MIFVGLSLGFVFYENNLRRNWKWFLYIFITFSNGTLDMVANAYVTELAWVQYRAYPGGPAVFLEFEALIPIYKVNLWFAVLTALMVDAHLIYRCTVLYKQRMVIVLPFLMWLASGILGPLLVVRETSFSRQTLKISLPYFAISLAMNMILCGLLVVRLLYMRRTITKALGTRHGRTYSNLAAIIAESSLPYGVVSFIFLVLYARGDQAVYILAVVFTQIRCMSPIITIIRVSRGRAWSNDTISDANLSRLRSALEKAPDPFRFRTPTHTSQVISRAYRPQYELPLETANIIPTADCEAIPHVKDEDRSTDTCDEI
jgi:hypothetical protein